MDCEGDTTARVADPAQFGVVEILHVGKSGAFRLVESEHIPFTRQVHAGAESAPCSGDDHGPDRVVVVHRHEGVLEFVGHLDGERIETVGTVEDHGEDAVLDFVAKGGVFHDFSRLPVRRGRRQSCGWRLRHRSRCPK